MKKWLCVTLCLIMVLGLCPAAAAEAVRPVPPSWVKPEEYAVFPGSKAYEPENWEKILALRADAEAGKGAPNTNREWEPYQIWTSLREVADRGVYFELGLIWVQFESVKSYYVYGGDWAYQDFDAAFVPEETSKENGIVELWRLRSRILEQGPKILPADTSMWSLAYNSAQLSIERCLAHNPGLTLDGILDHSVLDRREEVKAPLRVLWNEYGNRAFLRMDGQGVVSYQGEVVRAVLRGGRVLVPVRCLAEGLGAAVDWRPDTGEITMVRAGSTVRMTLGSTTAYLDGEVVEMDTAPILENGRTLIPVRYLGELFGQSVTWDAEKRTVSIQEDTQELQDSNLKAWALPMGAILQRNSSKNPLIFGGIRRLDTTGGFLGAGGEYAHDNGRRGLSEGWGVESREELIATVASMTEHGHNDSFLESAALINSLTDKEYKALLAESQGMDAYMWPYTKALSAKWGARGILAWDLFRMSNLVQWGYTAGYVTYPEALALLEPAAKAVCENFTSWDEAVENYLDGYNWWARNDMTGKDVWETDRGVLYRQMEEVTYLAALFDDTLFQTGVIPVPGITYQDLVNELDEK